MLWWLAVLIPNPERMSPAPPVGNRFPKSARLHHRSLQERLFTDGEKLIEYPLRMVWRSMTAEELEKNFCNHVPPDIGRVQVVVSVPKKKRRRAVDRVLMRRRIREAFRLSRPLLIQMLAEREEVRTVAIGLVYMKEANVAYKELKEKLDRLLVKMVVKINEKYDGKDEESVDMADGTPD